MANTNYTDAELRAVLEKIYDCRDHLGNDIDDGHGPTCDPEFLGETPSNWLLFLRDGDYF